MTSPSSASADPESRKPSAVQDNLGQAAQAASRLCIDCLHFRPAEFISYEARVRFAQCALTAKVRTHDEEQLVGITIEPTIEMEFCSKERRLGGRCGPSGLKFEPSGKRYERPSPQKRVGRFLGLFK